MNFHVVRTNETIEKIATLYNLTVDEIKSINAHIRDWTKLIPGTKLRLPEIPEVINEELDDVEPFIEDYYPKIDLNEFKKKEHEFETPITPVMAKQDENVPKLLAEPKQNQKEEKSKTIESPKPSTAHAKMPPYQYPYYPYYPYGYYGYPYPYSGYRTKRSWPTYKSRKGQKPS